MSKPFFDAIRAGDFPLVAQHLQADPSLANAQDEQNSSALHLAAEWDDVKIGLLLLQAGANPASRKGTSHHTPLSWAVTCQSPHFCKAMVAAGVKPDLFIAAGMGLLDEVKGCFDAADKVISSRVETGSSRVDAQGTLQPCPPPLEREQVADALYMACRNGHLEVMEFLLTKQPDLQFKAYLGAGLLHWAYFGNNVAIIEKLIQLGLDESERDPSYHFTPREFGIRIPHEWGLKHLVSAQLERDPSLIELLPN
jgi:ankyrin repeat protein